MKYGTKYIFCFMNTVGGKRPIGPRRCLHWARGPTQGKTPPRMGRIPLGMNIVEDKRGNPPLVVTLHIVPKDRKSIKAEKDNGEIRSV